MKTPLTNTIVLLACIATIGVLAYYGKVNGDAVVAIVSGVVGGVIGNAGTRLGANAANPNTPND